MITSQLLHPASIVVVGASNNVHKPGGAILKNLIHGGYTGELRAVNPKETEVQGVQAYADVKDIPDTDLAILAIPAVLCPDAVELLASEKRYVRSLSFQPDLVRKRMRARFWKTVFWKRRIGTALR
mgnify:CR=1 FL=1